MENQNQLQTQGETLSYEILESLVINGDLSKLDPKQKVQYYQQYCVTLGLNPVTQPFSILKLNGKEKLYCGREGTAQLSKVHDVSHDIVSTEKMDGVYIVKAKATTGTRHTTSTGVVTIENLKGEALCNAFMKAETKAKRRATLDLLGLGMLDETEVETIQNAKTEDVNFTDVTNQLDKSEDETLENKVVAAKLQLDKAEDETTLTNIWKRLSKEVKATEEIIEYVKTIRQNKGI